MRRWQRVARCSKDRCNTTVELADWISMFFAPCRARPRPTSTHVTEAVKAALRDAAREAGDGRVGQGRDRRRDEGDARGPRLKMPQLAIPCALLVCGRSQTPSIDAVLALFDRDVCCTLAFQ
jgi:glutamyl-tRNA synthetase